MSSSARAVVASDELPAGEPVEELVTRAQQGDRAAFASLYRTRVSAVTRYVGAILRDPDRAEDAVAETFCLAWRDLPKLRKPARFDAWLFRIAHNHALNLLRRPPTVPLEDAPEPADPSRFVAPAQALDRKMEAERVRGAVVELAPAQRDVLVLRFFRELAHAEIATQLGKSEQAVRALQYRALRELRKRMQTA